MQHSSATYTRPPQIFWLGLLLFFGLAAGLRLGWLGVNAYSYDEARLSYLALAQARAGQFASVGMSSSVGLPNFPAAVWLYALPFWLSIDPRLAIALTALANALAVIGLGWLAQRATGTWGGWLAAGLLAGSVWAVFYSRSIWAQNWLIPAAVLWALLSLQSWQQRGWAIALQIWLVLLLPQVHYAGFALLLPTAWLFWRAAWWRQGWAVLLGATAGLLCAGPMLWQLWLHPQWLAPLQNGIQRSSQVPAALGVLQVGWALLSGQNWQRFWLGDSPHLPVPAVLDIGGQLALAVALLVGIWRMVNTLRARLNPVDLPQKIAELCLVWALSSPLLFATGLFGAVLEQYLLLCLPAWWLGAAFAFRQPLPWFTSRWQALLLGSGWLVVILLQVLLPAALLGYVIPHSGTVATPNGLGTPLRYPQQFASALQGARTPIHSSGADLASDGDALIFWTLLWQHPKPIVDGRSALLLPNTVPAASAFVSADVPAWQIVTQLGGQPASFARRVGELPYHTWQLAQLPSPTAWPDWHWVDCCALQNGATLRAWRWQPLPSGGRLQTLWQIEQLPPAGQWQQFNHLYVANNVTLQSQVDASVSAAAWLPGDWLLTWADFVGLTAAPSRFEIGMYTLPTVMRSPYRLPDGQFSLDPLVLQP
jgi:hypothetical protein